MAKWIISDDKIYDNHNCVMYSHDEWEGDEIVYLWDTRGGEEVEIASGEEASKLWRLLRSDAMAPAHWEGQ